MSLSLSHWYPGSGVYLIISIPDLCILIYFGLCRVKSGRLRSVLEVSSSEGAFNTKAGIESGPVALSCFSLFMSLWTLFHFTLMSGINGYRTWTLVLE